jgi:acetolactate decarboxylase
MARKTSFLLAVILLLNVLVVSGCAGWQQDNDVLYQVSSIGALSRGDFDGTVTFKALKEHGEFGIGTFDGLDGEMVALGGQFYQIKADGKVYPVADSQETPFSMVTRFEPDRVAQVDQPLNMGQFTQYLDSLLPSKNVFYAIKVEGTFKSIKTRSVAGQSEPYPTLAEALQSQVTFDFCDVAGTMVGIRCPDYIEGVNVPGYRFHFITDDRQAGGHVLECQLDKVKIEIDDTPDLYMDLPDTSSFYKLDLTNQQQGEVGQMGKGPAIE